MRQQRNAMCAVRTWRTVKTQEMQRCAIRRRREYSRRCEKLTKIIAHTLKPGILRRRPETRKITRKRIAHGRASAPASDLARLLDETGGERVMRSEGNWIGCLRNDHKRNFLMDIQRKHNRRIRVPQANFSKRLSVEPEGHFNRTKCADWLNARARRWLEGPRLHRGHGVFIQSHPDALNDFDVGDPAIQVNHALNHDCALVLGFAGFFGIFRRRLIKAARRSNTIHASAENSAACAAALTGAKASAGAAADTGAIATPERIGNVLRQRVAEIRHVVVHYLQVWRPQQ